MAKPKAKSKTAAIREELKNHGGSPKLVAEALQKQGVKVTAQYVSVIKASDKRKAEHQALMSSGASKNEMSAARDLFEDAISLITKAGGATEAHKVIESAAALMEHVR